MIKLSRHAYPLEPAGQQELIGLWRSEWTRTDYDWLEALNGDYADTLRTVSVVARIDGRAVASATVNFAAHAPETCLIGNVVTLAAFRGQGLAKLVTDAAVAIGFEAGCTLAFLGSSRMEGNVYERCGFIRVAGSIMCRAAPGFEADMTFAPGHAVALRDAQWGDMTGFVRLLTQPLADAVIDMPRGLMSIAAADPKRCVSAFPLVHESVHQRGGVVLMLAAIDSSRIFGMGTLTPGPAPSVSHRGIVDVAAHASYATHRDEMLARLLAAAGSRRIETLEAVVVTSDTAKLEALGRAGFRPVATLPGHLRLRSGPADAVRLELKLT
jgi:GNAT superfamily N-acetyltransferase